MGAKSSAPMVLLVKLWAGTLKKKPNIKHANTWVMKARIAKIKLFLLMTGLSAE